MPKGSQNLILSRKKEIIEAVEKLYQTMNFKDITLREIADLTTVTRTSIYNYFQTKEEIFLELNKIEYEKWVDDLESIINSNQTLSKADIAHYIAKSLEKREQMLKLISMNHFDMEFDTRIEILKEFKAAYGKSVQTVKKLIKKFCQEMSEKSVDDFIYTFFPFMFGIYPYSVVSDKQKEAIKKAGVDFQFHTIYELTYSCIRNLLDKGDN